MVPRVLISHPGRQHVYQAVLAAQEAGMLQRFVTSYLWESPRFLSRALRLIASGSPLESALRARSAPWIDASRVITFPTLQLAARLALQLCLSMRVELNPEKWANRYFDRQVSRWLKAQPAPTVVHVFEGSARQTLTAAHRMGAATILDIPSAHECFCAEVNVERLNNRLGPLRQDREYLNRERDRADFLIVPSPYVARCLTEHGVGADKLVLLPYGVDAERFSPRPARRQTPFRSLFLGAVSFRKGIQYVLEGWKKAGLRGGELIVAGPIHPEVRPLLAQPMSGVRFVPHVPFSNVHELYQSADVFLFPSLAEGSALVTYEAMASGLPVILTSNCGAVARDGIDGFIVPPRDSDSIAERLQYLQAHPDARVLMGEAGRRRITERYTWRHYRQRLAGIYSAVTEGSDPRAIASAELALAH